MKESKEIVNLREEGLPFNIWISEGENMSTKYLWHEYTEIIYVIEGEISQRIGSTVYKMSKGDLIIINGLEMHSLNTEPGVWVRMLILQLPPFFLSLFYRQPKRCNVSNNFFKNMQDSSASKDLQECAQSIINELTRKDDSFRYFLTSLVYRLIGLIYRNSDKVDYNDDEYINHKLLLERLSPALEYIHNNFKTDIRLKDVAGVAGMGCQYFCKCFKNATTYTLTQYVNMLRIQSAQDMLSSPGASITETAYTVGFSSLSYFNRVFKKITGIGPKQFRRK